MNLSRRGFLTSLIASPAVIAIDNLMPVRLWVPTIYGDAVHDDWEGLTALINGEKVDIRSRTIDVIDRYLGFTSVNNTYSLSRPLVLADPSSCRRDAFIGDTFISRPEFEGEALIIGKETTILSSDKNYRHYRGFEGQGGSALLNCTAYFEKSTF